LSPEPGTGKGEPGTALVKVQRAKHPPCPVREIIAAWGELVPTQPPVRTEHLDAWIAAHGENVRARWRESPQRQTLDYWRAYFEAISKCGWLSGQVEGSNGRCFVRGLEWFVGRKNMVRVESGEFFARENRLGVTEEQMREAKAKIRSKATWGEGGVDL
jgi:hypothetical protein